MFKEAHLKIFGRVQGVFYRAEAQEKAQQLGLKGWAKNAADSTVEVLIQGAEASLQEFIVWSKKGPEMAHVTEVKVDFTTLPAKLYDEFRIF
ncbi:MAG: acylphosphatase [Candidatus Gracilibacteria bacterium]|jgi:acylphosphatase